jgi:tetratricopeptide (TPR) repeat protein
VAAVKAYERALALDPSRYDIHNGLGLALTQLERYEAALNVLQQGLVIRPDSAKLYASLGYVLDCKGDLASAAEAYRRAIKLDATLVSLHCQLALVYFGLGQLAEAVESFERARTLDATSADATFYLSTIHLLEGRFDIGWSEYESRWQTAAGRRTRRTFSQPLWKGEPLNGERILIYAEQGLGDTLHFARYVPLVAARGGQVILEVQPRLARLLSPTEGARQVVGTGEALPGFTWQCPLLSLPLAFATELSTIPARIPYVHAQPAHVEKWRQRLQADGLRIGISFAGSPNQGLDRWRSIPLTQLTPLLDVEGATFYSLQMGAPAAQIEQLGPLARLVDLQHQQEDFSDTAAIIANLDLVISVDTSVAHLAGAMGKPVWVLLHNAPDWRWMLQRDDSPWYPTARLFRQSSHGSWADVVANVARELRQLLAGRGDPDPTSKVTG